MGFTEKIKTRMHTKKGKVVVWVCVALLVITAFFSYKYFSAIFVNDVKNPGALYIREGASFNDVVDSLKVHDRLRNMTGFKWLAKKKKYTAHIRPGYYYLEKGMSINKIVNILRAGRQTPMRLTFNNVRTKAEFAAKIDRYLMADSTEILNLLNNKAFLDSLGFNENTIPCMFIPDTYEVWWTTKPAEFFKKMKEEYERFWNDSRLAKAKKLGLSPVEVSTLASIVQEETIKPDEKPRVAAVYLNRMNAGMPLQADPTVKFAVGDFSLRRILQVHTRINSPYNTYKHLGLPPGPIDFPYASSIDAVLNHENNDYLYFCARQDFSGYHNFARNFKEHFANAKQYRSTLDVKGIKK
ncbi:MAG: endolytic transglycosylase MltG [Bacteroidota bacterium]|nr:endolytic transglycosylase MltG [Bacteroidota bacterium]MDP4206914.1 endolytic transglycosylase MltG [Bacteroidota bacterium]